MRSQSLWGSGSVIMGRCTVGNVCFHTDNCGCFGFQNDLNTIIIIIVVVGLVISVCFMVESDLGLN
jgi:hypothetical protein